MYLANFFLVTSVNVHYCVDYPLMMRGLIGIQKFCRLRVSKIKVYRLLYISGRVYSISYGSEDAFLLSYNSQSGPVISKHEGGYAIGDSNIRRDDPKEGSEGISVGETGAGGQR